MGSARTALFNWLFARRHGGKFVLRLEDTDVARNTPEARKAIFESLNWLNLDWDEGPFPDEGGGEIQGQRGEWGPYCQSERTAIYQNHIERLLSEGKAYEDEGAVRFRMPDAPIAVHDLICGEVDFDLKEQDDLIIRRSNGSPVFHLVNVIDDLEMKITHVIRGEDHLSNTPKHVALYRGLGADPPAFAHIPLILNPTGSKMSKRDQGATIAEYRKRGFLPEALVNYLCLLGWTPPGGGEEIRSLSAVAEEFELTDVHRSNARFDHGKLEWMNGEYLRNLSEDDFVGKATLHLGAEAKADRTMLARVLPLLQEKVKALDELGPMIAYFFSESFEVEPKAEKKCQDPDAREALQQLSGRLSGLSPFRAEEIETVFLKLSEESGKKVGAFMAPCRAAVTGQMGGPSLYATLEILGKERVLDRINRVVKS